MIFFVTALHAEARPLVERFRLRGSDASAPFRIYRNDGIVLVVSGVGRVASAAATAWAFAESGGPRDRPWLNVGIAGHRDAAVGSCRLARKISDPTGRSWFPSLVFDAGMPTAELLTVDSPESRFERDALYDMEASAFFATASRLAPVELLHVLKIVSDNRAAPADQLDSQAVTDLVVANIDTIADFARRAEELADRLGERKTPGPDSTPWMGTLRFTRSEVRKLEGLLRRLQVVEGEALPGAEEIREARHARDVLAHLEDRLRRQGVAF